MDMILSRLKLLFYLYSIFIQVNSHFCKEVLTRVHDDLDEATLELFKEAKFQKSLRNIGKQLIIHKFYGIDSREDFADNPKTDFISKFPEPPLLHLPIRLQNECAENVIDCVSEIELLLSYNLSPVNKFRALTSASYFMCWYTMSANPLLMHFNYTCQLPHLYDQTITKDVRDSDTLPFDCALHSFCPDPCCGNYKRPGINDKNNTYMKGIISSKRDCLEDPNYPCDFSAHSCSLDFKNNKNIYDLMQNKLNHTCSCSRKQKGFVWNDQFKMCVDYNECEREEDNECDENSVCRNLMSSYYCTCDLGYVFNFTEKKCIQDKHSNFTRVMDIAINESLLGLSNRYGLHFLMDIFSSSRSSLLIYKNNFFPYLIFICLVFIKIYEFKDFLYNCLCLY